MRESSWYFLILGIAAVYLVGAYAGLWGALKKKLENMRKHRGDPKELDSKK